MPKRAWRLRRPHRIAEPDRISALRVVGGRVVGRWNIGRWNVGRWNVGHSTVREANREAPTYPRPHDQRSNDPLLRFLALSALVFCVLGPASAADRFPYEIVQIGGTTGMQREVDRTIEGRLAAGANQNPFRSSGLTTQRVHVLDFTGAPALEGAQLNLTFEVIPEAGVGPEEPLLFQVFRAAKSENQPADSRWPPGWVVREAVDMGRVATSTPMPQRQVTVRLTPGEVSGVLILADNEGGRSGKRYRIHVTRLRRQPIPRDLSPEQMTALRTDRASLFESMATLLEPRNWDQTKGADLLLGRDYDTLLKLPLARVAELTGLTEYADAAVALDALKALPRSRARQALRVLNIAALTAQGNLLRGAGRLREAGAAARRNDLPGVEKAVELARSEITIARTAAEKLPESVFSAEARGDARTFIAAWVHFLRAERQYLGLEDVDAPPAAPAPAPTPPPQ